MEPIRTDSRIDRNRGRMPQIPWVNYGLAAVNVLLFLICTFTGDLLYNKGAVGVRQIMADQSYYRIVTSMFLHWNVRHLFNNMIILLFVGDIVEKKMGHIAYAVIYFLSGIGGGILSLGYELLSGGFYSSVGASGAVFGVEGALLLLVIMNRGRLDTISLPRLLFAIFFSLYCGFTDAGTNNAAHIGGVVTGFAVAAILTFIRPHRTRA